VFADKRYMILRSYVFTHCSLCHAPK